MRYTVEIPEKMAEIFKNIANEAQITQAELFRRALVTYSVLQKEIQNGNVVTIANNGKILKELILS